MRYTCFRVVTTKVFDSILSNFDDIYNLLTMLKNKEITCSMQIKFGLVYDHVRILDVTESLITWRLMKNGNSLKKVSAISEILSLEVHSNEDLMIKLKPDPTRASTLEITE